MKKLLVPLFIALSAAAFTFAGNASAAEGKSMTPQQQKFADCAHKSKGMKGEEHKKFMRECLKGSGTETVTQSAAHKVKTAASSAEEKPTNATTEQREKMKTCNAQAKDKKLKGKDRRSFMSQCLQD